MDLKRKLSRLDGTGLRPGGPAPAPAPAAGNELRGAAPPAVEPASEAPGGVEAQAQVARLQRGLATLRPPARGPAGGATSGKAPRKRTPLPAQERSTPHGPLFAREHLYDEAYCHGSAPVRAALTAEPHLISALALDPSLRAVDPRGMLLLDTETTGLAGGTGTLPFVIGLGWFEGERLKVTQLLLRRPGEERPMLELFAERLAQASCLVSYNGKTFDWPLLRSRFVMNRMTAPSPGAHLDLLHCARRVFRRRMSGARLVQLEEEVLGFRRVDDVPGSEIPDLYFRYLRTGNGALLAPVLEHNVHDMALLAALLGELVRQFRDAEASSDPRDQLGFANVAARAGDGARAVAFAEAAAAAGDRALCAEALALAAEVSRKSGDVQAAVGSLERAVEVASGALLSQVHLALAKLHEHRTGQLARALDHARHTLLAEGALAHAKRLARLERRAAADARVAQVQSLNLRLLP